MPSLAELKKEQKAIRKLLARKKAEAQSLRKRIASKRTELERLESALAEIVGGRGKGQAATSVAMPRKRARNTITQKALVCQILREAGKPVHLDNIIATMKKKGYKFSARNPKQALGVTLYPDKQTFAVPKRGFFALK
jgi:hypothetical protein